MLLSLLAPLAWAGELILPTENEFSVTVMRSSASRITGVGHKIVFAEPVVPNDYLYGYDAVSSSDLFDITGDGPLPMGKWDSATELKLYFPADVTPGARFKLSFKPGKRQYLSGRPMQCADFEFEAPPCKLEVARKDEHYLLAGREAGEVLLESASHLYRVADLVSMDTRFEFFLYRTGETVPGVAMPARVKDLRPKALQERYRDASREQLAALTPDTIVPGLLLVQPLHPITEYWELRAVDSTGKSCLASDRPIYGRFDTELRAELHTSLAQYQGKTVACLGLLFNAPIARDAVSQLFRDTEFRCGDAVAEHIEGTLSKKLVWKGKEIILSLHEETAYGDNKAEIRTCFPNRGVDRLVVRLEGEADLPLPLSATVPAGTRALFGLRMPQAQTCSTVLQVLAPALPVQDSSITVPLHGKHRLDLQCLGCRQVRAELAYLPQPELKKMLLADGDSRRDTLETWLKVLKNDFGPEQVYTVQPDGLNPCLLSMDLDALSAEPLKAGSYVLHLRAEHDAPPAEGEEYLTTPYTEEVVLYLTVTDMEVLTACDKLLVYRLSDAAPLPQAQVLVECCDSFFDAEREWEELLNTTLHQGVLKLPRDIGDTYLSRVLVSCGDDVAETLYPQQYIHYQKHEAEPPTHIRLLTDRFFYKPGETVHLFGTARKVNEQGALHLAGVERANVRLIFDSEVIVEQEVQLNAHGAFSADIVLPADAVGDMSVRVTLPDGSVQSEMVVVQALQRDSFALRCRTEMKPVNPDKLTVWVDAQDYNGTPVAGTAEISVSIMGDVSREMSATVELDASGKACCPFCLTDLPKLGEGDYRYAEVMVSVTNQRQEEEEYVSEIYFYTAEHELITKDNRLFCRISGTERAVPHAQQVQVWVDACRKVPEMLPNGILYPVDKASRVRELTVTVPADSQDGVLFDFDEIDKEILADHPELRDIDCSLRYTLRATGADGSTTQARVNRPVGPEHEQNEAQHPLTATVQDGEIQLLLPEGVEGKLLLVLETPVGLRMVAAERAAGQTAVCVPLLPQEYGQPLGVAVIHMALSTQGIYEPQQWLETELMVPPAEDKLQVQLHLPHHAVLPGQVVELSGCVTTASGEPAAHASLCLFAVDKGIKALDRDSPFSFTLFHQPGDYGDFMLKREHFERSNYYDSARRYQLMHMLAGPQEYLIHLLTPQRWVQWDEEGEFSSRGFSVYGKHYGRLTLVEPQQLWLHFKDPFEDDFSWGSGGGYGMGRSAYALGDGMGADALGAVDCEWSIQGDADSPRVRRDFTATPIWMPSVYTDAQGRFSVQCAVADTLTTYKVYAVALSEDGRGSGTAEGEFMVNQPVMITAGVPFFMSVGDSLRLPLTVTNNTDTAATWSVSLQGAAAPQSATLQPRESCTLYFEVTATAAGDQTLLWRAENEAGGDALEERVTVRFPAPELREIRYLCLQAGDAPLNLASLFDEKMQGAEITLAASAHPLSNLSVLVDFALKYPHGCTEQKSSVLIPWLLHDSLAPLCPNLAQKDAAEVRRRVQRCVDELMARQTDDGGLGYWDGADSSCLWASAHAAMVLAIAQERGFDVPQESWADLCNYLRMQSQSSSYEKLPPFAQYAVGYALGDDAVVQHALERALRIGTYEYAEYAWMRRPAVLSSMRMLHALRGGNPHAAAQPWLQTLNRHGAYLSSWDAGWVFVALHQYLRTLPQQDYTATLRLKDGSTLQLGHQSIELPADSLQCVQGCAYLTVRACVVPAQLQVAAVADKGIHLQRTYEKQAADGSWAPADDFDAGDEVRVTVQCVVLPRGAQYLVIEDYLPSCFKPYTRADGSWSHTDFSGERMRIYCDTPGNDVITLQYHARAVYSGSATAPPASAQLLYEPQVYGLSDSQQVRVKP